ncbi:MAG: dihydropteroate synthase [Spirochaetota bacterium]|nr:dihydropteroate synthase [Spirochaetota bacterium]
MLSDLFTYHIPLSIDTYKSAVAEEALKLGATVVNDISGLSFDKKMTDVVVKYKSHIILMHIKGTPENMQHNPKYSDLIGEIYGFLDNARNTAIRNGINKEKIIIDPGIGFGKTVEHNYQIISNLEYFKKMEAPILIGLSRKSLIGKLYDNGSNRLPATIALNSLCVINGADIIRVHDVKEHKLALTALEMIKKVNNINGNCN